MAPTLNALSEANSQSAPQGVGRGSLRRESCKSITDEGVPINPGYAVQPAMTPAPVLSNQKIEGEQTPTPIYKAPSSPANGMKRTSSASTRPPIPQQKRDERRDAAASQNELFGPPATSGSGSEDERRRLKQEPAPQLHHGFIETVCSLV